MEREGKKRLNSEKEYENIQKKSRRACWLASETTHDSTTSTDGVEWNGERERKLVKLLHWAWHLIADFDRFRLDILLL